MNSYSDFMLNELAGMSGLDFDQTNEILMLLEDPAHAELEDLESLGQ